MFLTWPLSRNVSICNSVRPKFGIGRKYRSIWVSVSVSDWNQSSGFGRTLIYNSSSMYNCICILWKTTTISYLQNEPTLNMDWCILSTLGKKCYDHAKKVIYIYEKCFDDVLATSCYNPLAHRAKVAKSCYSFEGAREHSMLSRVPLLPLLFLL